MTNRPGRLMVSPDPRRARTEARGANRTRWRCFVNLLVADWVFPPLFPKASPMPRHTSLGPDSFDSVWGYCAVVGTRELLWSGHRIPEPASLSELRSEEHTSELQSLMRISYAVFCLKKTNQIIYY